MNSFLHIILHSAGQIEVTLIIYSNVNVNHSQDNHSFKIHPFTYWR